MLRYRLSLLWNSLLSMAFFWLFDSISCMPQDCRGYGAHSRVLFIYASSVYVYAYILIFRTHIRICMSSVTTLIRVLFKTQVRCLVVYPPPFPALAASMLVPPFIQSLTLPYHHWMMLAHLYLSAMLTDIYCSLILSGVRVGARTYR